MITVSNAANPKVTSKNRFAKDKYSDTKQFKAEKWTFSGFNRRFFKRRIEKCSRKIVREAIFRGCLKVTSKNRFAKDKFSDTKQFKAEKLTFSGSNRRFF